MLVLPINKIIIGVLRAVQTKGLRYISRFMFWLYLKVPASLRVPGTPPDVKYTSGSQVHVALHILGIFEGTWNPPGPRYTPGSQVYPRVSGTPPGLSYTSGSQVHVALYILGIFEGTCNPPGPRYTPGSPVHPRVPGTPLGSRYIPGSQVYPRFPCTPPGFLMIIKSPPHLQRASKVHRSKRFLFWLVN